MISEWDDDNYDVLAAVVYLSTAYCKSILTYTAIRYKVAHEL